MADVEVRRRTDDKKKGLRLQPECEVYILLRLSVQLDELSSMSCALLSIPDRCNDIMNCYVHIASHFATVSGIWINGK